MMRNSRGILAFVVLTVLTHIHESGSSVLRTSHQRVKRQEALTCVQGDLIFLLDSSGSVGLDNWQLVLEFVHGVILKLEVGELETRVGALYFSNFAHPIFQLNEYYDKVAMATAVLNTPWKDQNTNISGAINYMKDVMFTQQNGARVQAPNVGIVITDGASNRDANNTIPMAEAAKMEGITMIALGIGTDVNLAELHGIASSPNHVLEAISFEALNLITPELVTLSCDIPVECRGAVDLMLILDASGSVREENFQIMKEFVKKLISTINIGPSDSHVGLMTFSNEAYIEFHMNSYESRYSALKAIDDVIYRRGTTNTADALGRLHAEAFRPERGDRAGVDNIAVLFTDGGSNNMEDTIWEATLAREAGITLLVVAVSSWVNMYEINEIATDPDMYNVFTVMDFEDINEITSGLKNIICNQIIECISNPCQNGGTCIDSFNRYYCQCEPGFAGVNCEQACPDPADIVIALDSSGSINTEKFFMMLDWIKHFVNHLNIGQSRLGLETFANDVEVKFYMNEYSSRQEIINVISFPYSQGTTDTATALATMQGMFSEQLGDRPSARNYGIVITDGQSNDRDATFQQAVSARMSGIYLIGVGVALKSLQGLNELQGIASDPDEENIIIVNDFSALYNITDTLLSYVCNVPDACGSGGEGYCEAGGTCIDGLNSYSCECPPSHTGPNCELDCDGQADVVFVVDGSGSIRENRFETVKDYIASVVALLEVHPDRTRIGLVIYSDEAHTIINLNTYSFKEDIIHVIRNMLWLRGKTNTAAGLRMMRENMFTAAKGDREDVPNYAVVISDGESNVDAMSTIPEAIESRIQGIHIIVVTVTEQPNLELKGIASDPDDKNILYVENFSQLPELVGTLNTAMCDDFNECDSNPCQNNGFCINGLYQYLCFCADEFTGINCERSCGRRMDVVFVLDSSGSVQETLGFDLILQLTRLLVEGMNFAGARTRVGVLTYSDNPTVRFHLNQYSDKQSILNAIAFIREIGQTNTAGGIDEMRLNMFTSFNGDRAGDPNYAIVITDGRSNINSAQTIPSADEARNAGITMIAVGVGQNGHVDRGELNGIANDPDNQYMFLLEKADELDQVANNILDFLCQ